jgi:hypothetical protein
VTRVVRVPHHQDGVAAFVSGTGQVDRTFRMEKGRARFFHEGAPRIGEVDDPTFLPDKKAYLVLVFQFVNLFAESRLADAQDVRRSREVQFFGENNDRV